MRTACLALLLLAAACRPADGAAPTPQATASQATSPQPFAQPAHAASTLQQLADVLLSPRGRDWAAYDAVTGVQWDDAGAAPRTGDAAQRVRTGRMVLQGVGDPESTGGSLAAGEGSLLTISGSETAVQRISVKRLRETQNPPRAVRAQFDARYAVRRVADDCRRDGGGDGNPAGSQFVSVTDAAGRTLHVETYFEDADHDGREYTVFDLLPDDPSERMAAMGCTHVSVGGRDPVEASLREGMAYADLRSAVLEQGWAPIVDSQCRENVLGGSHEDICRARPDGVSCQICSRLPELASCSGDGYCGMYFSKGAGKLHVVTYGDYGDWNVRGESSGLEVLGWDFSGAE